MNLGIQKAADLAHVSYEHMRAMGRRGEIPTRALKGRMFFATEDVEAWKSREEARQTMIAAHHAISHLRGRYDSPRDFLDAALQALTDLYPDADGS